MKKFNILDHCDVALYRSFFPQYHIQIFYGIFNIVISKKIE